MDSGVGRIQLVMVSYMIFYFYPISDYEYISCVPLPSFPSVIIFCSDLSIGNGFVVYSNEGSTNKRPVGTTAFYTCISGYILIEDTPSVRTCESNGQWSGSTPTCQS